MNKNTKRFTASLADGLEQYRGKILEVSYSVGL